VEDKTILLWIQSTYFTNVICVNFNAALNQACCSGKEPHWYFGRFQFEPDWRHSCLSEVPPTKYWIYLFILFKIFTPLSVYWLGYGMGNLVMESCQGQVVFFSPTNTSRLALVSNQHPIQWVRGLYKFYIVHFPCNDPTYTGLSTTTAQLVLFHLHISTEHHSQTQRTTNAADMYSMRMDMPLQTNFRHVHLPVPFNDRIKHSFSFWWLDQAFCSIVVKWPTNKSRN
jgi:hypothetical protein